MFFNGDMFIPLFALAIPIIAIIGGITAGIVKTISRQRMIELAQRERIAAIERGIDPSKIPPIPQGLLVDDDAASAIYDPVFHQHRRRQGLVIGGIVTLFVGAGLMAFLILMHTGDNAWAVGIIPMSVGIALLLSAALIRPMESSNRPPVVR